MRLHTLGTGGPRPDPDRGSACHVLEIGSRRLLFDVGRGAIQRIAQKRLSIASLGPLFISHLHVDHVGELANYLITSWMSGRRQPVPVFGPPGTADMIDLLVHRVYELDVRFRTEGETAMGPFVGASVTEVRRGPVVETAEYRVSCEEMEHGHRLPFDEDFRSRWICLGFRVEAEGKVFSFGGDGIMNDALVSIASGADLHLQCCYLARSELAGNDHLRAVSQYTIACSDTAGKIAARAGVRRLVLTHFRGTTPDLLREIEADVREDYRGPLAVASDLDDFEF
jgi:ribonuclease BN (tRNA processing enzyme)